jgi:hypothetical protein
MIRETVSAWGITAQESITVISKMKMSPPMDRQMPASSILLHVLRMKEKLSALNILSRVRKTYGLWIG